MCTFQSEVSIFPILMGLPKLSPARLQSQIFWRFSFPVQDPSVVGHMWSSVLLLLGENFCNIISMFYRLIFDLVQLSVWVCLLSFQFFLCFIYSHFIFFLFFWQTKYSIQYSIFTSFIDLVALSLYLLDALNFKAKYVTM